MKKYVENEDFGGVVTPSEEVKIVEFSQCQKYEKALYYLWRSWIFDKKLVGYKNNFEILSATKEGEHILSGLSYRHLKT